MTTALAFVLGFTALAPQSTQPPSSTSTPIVVATGEGVVKRAPDRAWVTVTAESRAMTPQEAQ